MSDAIRDAADRAERQMSISKAAALLGRDRGTLSEWIRKGCPVARSGGTGDATLVDLKAVVVWREEQIRSEERARFPAADGSAPGSERMTMADRKALSVIRANHQKLAMNARILIHREPMQHAYVRCLGLIRQAVMSIPERITREMAGYPEEQVREWRLQALGQCRAALAEGAKSLNDAMQALSEDPEDHEEIVVDDIETEGDGD